MANAVYKMDTSGIRAISMSTGMQAALQSIADSIAAKANADAYTDTSWLYEEEYRTAPYGSAVDVLNNTAVGVAFTRSIVGALNENRRKSLTHAAFGG